MPSDCPQREGASRSVVGEPAGSGLVGGVAAADAHGDHLDGVGMGLVGYQPVDDPEALGVLAGKVEAKPPTAGEVARDVTGAEEFACLAACGEVHDGLQGDVDQPVVDLVQGAEVVEDLR